MPRDGSGVMHKLNPDVVSNTTISSTVYNGDTQDIINDLNTPRPIVAGGTGATSAPTALAALSGEQAGQVVTNYDSFGFVSGSFYSLAGATSEPVSGHNFSGICYARDSNNMVVYARDYTDGRGYYRLKSGGTWGGWSLDQSGAFVAKAGDTMTGLLTLSGDPASALQAATKQYVDARPYASFALTTRGLTMNIPNPITVTLAAQAGLPGISIISGTIIHLNQAGIYRLLGQADIAVNPGISGDQVTRQLSVSGGSTNFTNIMTSYFGNTSTHEFTHTTGGIVTLTGTDAIGISATWSPISSLGTASVFATAGGNLTVEKIG